MLPSSLSSGLRTGILVISLGLLTPLVSATSVLKAQEDEGTVVVRNAGVLDRLGIGAQLQVQQATSNFDEGRASEFRIRRARLYLDARISGMFRARIQPDFVDGRLRDAWMEARFENGIRLRAGQFKRPFDLFHLQSSTRNPVIERDGRVSGAPGCGAVGGLCSHEGILTGLQYSGRDVGAQVSGSTGRVDWAALISNGAGENGRNDPGEASLSGRATLGLTDDLTIGGSFSSRDYEIPRDGTDPETEWGVAWSGEAQFGEWGDRFHLLAAVASGDHWTLDSADPPTFRVAQLQWSSWIGREGEGGWESVIRVSWADPHLDADDDASWIVTPGIAWHLKRGVFFSANLDWFHPEAGEDGASFKVQSYLTF